VLNVAVLEKKNGSKAAATGLDKPLLSNLPVNSAIAALGLVRCVLDYAFFQDAQIRR
jgi:hypothetical protein